MRTPAPSSLVAATAALSLAFTAPAMAAPGVPAATPAGIHQAAASDGWQPPSSNDAEPAPQGREPHPAVGNELAKAAMTTAFTTVVSIFVTATVCAMTGICLFAM